uniref:KANL3/Tex30 alpha/beta hydrolase-like domain-containing protein n=1 Tax=Clytia hemisphaerica TaxID=252671 RepID=A0A7M5WYM9_9CNID
MLQFDNIVRVKENSLDIPFGEKRIPAIITSHHSSNKDNNENAWVILTHGAGGDMNTKQLYTLSQHFASSGFTVLRFTCKPPNFKYRVKVFTQVIEYARTTLKASRVIIGGRSMGGRVAAEIACQSQSDSVIDGVFCLSYPLHKSNDHNNLRTSHLKGIEIPILIVNGTKDTMCDMNLMNEQFNLLPCISKTLNWIENADHSLENKNFEQTMKEVGQMLVNWCSSVI